MRVSFGPFVLDADARQLTRDGHPLHLSPKAFQLLCLLVRARPAVLDRAALRDQLWPDTHVVAASLGNLVAEIRGVLGGEGSGGALLRTVHGVGYAFSGHARDEAPAAVASPRESVRFWLVWEQRPIAVESRDIVIGRDPGCDVWIDAPGVSRRHARITTEEQAGEARFVVEDVGSTNGTYIGTLPVHQPTRLKDEDTIRLGDVTLAFRTRKQIDAPTKRVRPPRS